MIGRSGFNRTARSTVRLIDSRVSSGWPMMKKVPNGISATRAAFAAAKLAGSDPMGTGYVATRFGWSAFVVPILFIFSPSLLLDGTVLELAHDISTAIFGVWLVSIGMVGYFRRLLAAATRFVFATAGLLLLIPATMFAGAGWTDLAGLAIGGLIVGREFLVPKVQPSAAQ